MTDSINPHRGVDRRKRRSVRTGMTVLLLLSAGTALADRDWTGADTASWFVGTNWSPVGVPFDETVVIDTVTPNPTVLAGAAASTIDTLLVGDSDIGQLTLQGGGQLPIDGNASLGAQPGAVGTVVVEGAGTQWNQSGSLTVGLNGNGFMSIGNSAAVSAGFIGIGGQPDSHGSLTISSGAQMSGWANVVVGQFGEGELTIQSGGTLDSGSNAYIGTAPPSRSAAGTIQGGGPVTGGSGSVLVAHPGSHWDVTGTLRVRHGQLSVQQTGAVTAADAIVGTHANSIADVLVEGSGSHWQLDGELIVADLGQGALLIGEDASVTAQLGVIVADQAGAVGTLRVDGTLAAPGGLVVRSGGWLGGAGEVDASTQLSGTLAPGDPVGLLNFARLLILPEATLVFDLAEPGQPGNDQVGVAADLAIDGVLEINPLPGFGAGTYRLFGYGGSLVDNGLEVASLPPGYGAAVDTSNAGRVELVVWELGDAVFADRFELP